MLRKHRLQHRKVRSVQRFYLYRRKTSFYIPPDSYFSFRKEKDRIIRVEVLDDVKMLKTV